MYFTFQITVLWVIVLCRTIISPDVSEELTACPCDKLQAYFIYLETFKHFHIDCYRSAVSLNLKTYEEVNDTVSSGGRLLLNCKTSAQFTQLTACHVPSVYLVLNTELTRRK
jgi:hypothetical protein